MLGSWSFKEVSYREGNKKKSCDRKGGVNDLKKYLRKNPLTINSWVARLHRLFFHRDSIFYESMTPCDDDLQMRAQCAFAVMMRMLMMTTGMDALSRGEGGFPALPHETPRPARPSPAQSGPAKMVETGEQWRGKIRFTLSYLFNSGNPS